MIGALRSERFDVLLGYAQANGSETKNQGSNSNYGPTRTTANPAETEDRGLLAKLGFPPGHRPQADGQPGRA